VTPEARLYQEEIFRRGAIDRSSGIGIDRNPYREVNYLWPDILLEFLRLAKKLETSHHNEVKSVFESYSADDQDRIRSNPKIVALMDEISAIREHAHQIWEQGWMSGRHPKDPVDLSDMLRDTCSLG
jgi:hypothetical protein